MVPVRRYARHWLAYLACGGLGLATHIKKSWINNRQTGPDQQQSTNHSKKRPAPARKCKDREHATEDEHRTAEQYGWRWSTVLNGVTVIFTGVAAIYAVRTFEQTKRQVDISERGSRPYMLANVLGDIFKWDPVRDELTAVIAYANYGSTPAVITRIDGGISLELPLNCPCVTERHTTDLILLANDVKNGPQRTYELSLYGRRGAHGSPLYLTPYIYGRIFYTDATGKEFHTFFCYQRAINLPDRQGVRIQINRPNCPTEVE